MSKVQSGVVRIDNMEKYLCTMIKHFRAIFGEKCREIFIKELLINASYACIKKVSSLVFWGGHCCFQVIDHRLVFGQSSHP